MKTEVSINILRDIETVFDYTISNVPEWSQTVISDEIVQESNQGGKGTTFHVVTEDRGRKMEFDGEVLHQNRPLCSHVFLTGFAFDIDIEYIFEDLRDKGTRVTQRSRVIAKNIFFKFMFFSIGWLMKPAGKRALKTDLETLKQQLESQQAISG